MDLLQIEKKGNLLKQFSWCMMKKVVQVEFKVNMEFGKQSAVKQIFDSLLGMSASASASAGINGNITESETKQFREQHNIWFLDTVGV